VPKRPLTCSDGPFHPDCPGCAGSTVYPQILAHCFKLYDVRSGNSKRRLQMHLMIFSIVKYHVILIVGMLGIATSFCAWKSSLTHYSKSLVNGTSQGTSMGISCGHYCAPVQRGKCFNYETTFASIRCNKRSYGVVQVRPVPWWRCFFMAFGYLSFIEMVATASVMAMYFTYTSGTFCWCSNSKLQYIFKVATEAQTQVEPQNLRANR